MHGVIHAAGVLEDGLVWTKKPDSLRRVFAPKVQGTLNLDLVTRDEPLVFFLLCSSLASIGGNVGQADYAAANRFLDAFAELRGRWRTLGQRRGRTVSINWPYWSEGGMKMDQETLAGLERASGLQPMQSDLGCTAFEACVGLDLPQVVVINGDREKFERFLNGTVSAPATGVIASLPAKGNSEAGDGVVPAVRPGSQPPGLAFAIPYCVRQSQPERGRFHRQLGGVKVRSHYSH